MEEQHIADPIPSGGARRASALIGWLLLAVSVPPALGLLFPALSGSPYLFWSPGLSLNAGWRVAGAPGAVFCVCCWFFANWGLLVPPLLAVLALARVLPVRRAVGWTAAYVIAEVAIRAFWSYLLNQGRPGIARFIGLEQFLKALFPGLVPLVLTRYRWPVSPERPWRWAAGVTRIVLVCLGVLGLLLIGFLLRSGVFRPSGSGPYLATTVELIPYYARHGVQAALHVVQLGCAYLLVRHGVLRRRWLWLATGGAALAWGLSLMLAQTLESVATVRIRLPREERFLLQGLLASLAAAAGVLLWYWWPVLVGRVPPQLTDEPLCPTCGYNLTGNVSGRCPECGETVNSGRPGATRDPA